MKAELNNGLTATASIKTKVTGATPANTTAVTMGNIVISGANASIGFGSGLKSAVYEAVGDSYSMGGLEDTFQGVVASYSMGESTIYVGAPVAFGAKAALGDVEIAGKTNVSGWSLSAAAKKIGGKNEFAAKFSGAVAGATISGGFGTVDLGGKANQWDIKAEYPVGPVTVSAAYDEASVYVLGAKYSANGVTVAAEYTKGGAWKADASYAYGSGVNVFAGLAEKGKDIYVGATYDLGAGATLTGSYVKDGGTPEADKKIGAKDYAPGATVKVSFKF